MKTIYPDYQEEFVQFVSSLEFECAPSLQLESLFKKNTRHRLNVYQKSFRGRVLSSLVDSVLSPLYPFYGENVVKEVVARYFSKNLPQSSCMIAALENLPHFTQKNSNDWYSIFFAEMARLCLEYKNFIVSDDSSYFFEGKAKANFYAAWNLEKEQQIDIDTMKLENDFDLVHVLFLRVEPELCVSVAVPHSLKNFVLELLKTNSVSCALSNLKDEEIDSICENELKRLILEIKHWNLFQATE